MMLAGLGLATEITRGDIGHIIQMPLVGRERRKSECLPLCVNLLDIPVFAGHEIMVRHS